MQPVDQSHHDQISCLSLPLWIFWIPLKINSHDIFGYSWKYRIVKEYGYDFAT